MHWITLIEISQQVPDETIRFHRKKLNLKLTVKLIAEDESKDKFAD